MRKKQNNSILEEYSDCLTSLQSNLKRSEIQAQESAITFIKRKSKLDELSKEYEGFAKSVELNAKNGCGHDKKLLDDYINIKLTSDTVL